MNEELQKLYQALQQSGAVQNLPEYEQFEQTLTGNEKAQRALYDNVKQSGAIQGLPEFQQFQSRLFNGASRPGKAELPDKSDPGTFTMPGMQSAVSDSPNAPTRPAGQPVDREKLPKFVELNLKAQNYEKQARENMTTNQDNLRVPDPVAMDKAKRYRKERDRELKALDTGQSRLSSGFGSFMQALGNTLGTDTIRSLAVIQAGVMPGVQGQIAQARLASGTDPLYNFGTAIGEKVKEIFPNNPAYQEEFLTSILPSGAGSMSAFLAGGVLGKGVKATSAISGAIGALSVSGNEYNTAIENGASSNEAFSTWMLNLPIGGIEAIPIFNSLKNLNRVSNGGVTKILKEGFEGGMEELVQEVGQNLASNTAAHNIYDESRRWWEGVAEGGGAGFILGAFMRGTATGISQLKNKTKDAAARRILEKTENELNEAQEELEARPGGLFSLTEDVPGSEGQLETFPIESSLSSEADPQDMLAELETVERDLQARKREVAEQGGDTGVYDTELDRIKEAQEILAESIPGAQRERAQADAQASAQQQPITPEGKAFVNKVQEEGGVPGFITNNLRKIARENGIQITERTSPQDIVTALQEKIENRPDPVKDPQVKPVKQLEQELAELRRRKEEGSNDPGLDAQITQWEQAIASQESSGDIDNIGTKPLNVIGKPSTDTDGLSLAFKTGTGEVYTAPREQAPNHTALFDEYGIDVEQTDGGGFMTPDGRYLTRNEASQYMNELRGESVDDNRGSLLSEDFIEPAYEPEQYEVLGGSAIAEYNNQEIKILDPAGNEINPNDVRHSRAVAEFLSNQTSPAGQVERAPSMNDIQYAQAVSEQSSNPVEIANAMAQVEDIQGSTDSDLQNQLRERFQEITGTELSPQLAQQIQNRTERRNPNLAMSQEQDLGQNEVRETVGEMLGDKSGIALTATEAFDAIDGGEYFSDSAKAGVEGLNRPKSRATIVYMTPEEYLSLLPQRALDNLDMDALITADEIISNDEQFDAIPELNLKSVPNSDENYMHVTNFKGAVEATVLNDNGVQRIPVRVSHPTFRWGDNTDIAPDFIFGADNDLNEMAENIGTRVQDVQSVFYPKDINERNVQPTGRTIYTQPDDKVYGAEGNPRAEFGPAQSTPGTGGVTSRGPGKPRLPQFVGALDREPGVNKDWTKDPISLRPIINNLIKTLNLQVAKGLPKGSGNAEGIFSSNTGIIRLKVLDAIEVLAHEAGHKIDFMTPGIDGLLREYADELKPLAYDGVDPSILREEGFAEFFRVYMLNPGSAKAAAPNFYPAFEKYLKSDPAGLPEGIYNQLDDVRSAYAQFLEQPSEQAVDGGVKMATTKGERLVSFFKENSLMDVMRNMKYRAYETIVGEDYALLVALRKLKDIHYENTGENADISPMLDFYKLNRVSLDSYSAGAMDIEHGVQNYHTLEPEGPSIRDALSLALGEDWNRKRRQEFSAYLVARRVTNEWDRFHDENDPLRNRPWKFSKADAETKIKVTEGKKGNENWKKAADMINEYNRNMFAKLVDAGLITQDVYNDATSRIPFYVPLFREQYDEDGRITNESIEQKRRTGKETVIKRFKGSDRDILDPIESMMKMSYQFNNAIKQNDVKMALIRMINKAGMGSGQIGEEIDSKRVVGKTISAQEIRKHLKESSSWAALDDIDAISLGIGKSQFDNLDFPDMTFFRQEELKEGGRPIVYAWDNGKKRALQLTNTSLGIDIYNVLSSQPQRAADIVANTLAYPASMLRTGITTEPSFFIANLVRDQISAWVLTDIGFTPFTSISKDLKNRFNETVKSHQGPVSKGEGVDSKTQEDYSRLYRSWSGISTFNVQALDPERAKQEIESLKTKNITVRRLKSVRGLNELLDLSEIGTRLSVFQRAFRKAKGQGMTDKEAAIEAGFMARDLIDFGRHGSRMQHARRLVPFLNASIQGLDKGARVLSAEGQLLRAVTPYIKEVNGRPLDKQERADLTNAKKAWLKVMEIGSIGAMLTALYADDPDYDEIPQYLKSTHWIVPDFTAGEDEVRKFVAVPKPFELAIMSNTFESAIQGYKQQDPQWYKSWSKSMMDIIAPPISAPGLTVPAEVWANKRTFDGRPIVYQRMLGLEPWRQYNAYTSELGKGLGRVTNTSPALIDHAITGVTGSWGRVALQATTSINPDAPQSGWDDTWVVRRFVRSSDRGSRSTKRFYELAGKQEGVLSSKANTFKSIADNDSPEDAVKYYNNLEDWQKGYVAMKYIPKKERELYPGLFLDHPFDHARKATQVLSQMRRELFGERKDVDDPTPDVFAEMSAERKREADDLIDRMATVYLRNALIASNEPRSKGRTPMDMKKWLTTIRVKFPEMHQEMTRRFNQSNIDLESQGQYDNYNRYANTPEVMKRIDSILDMEMQKLKDRRNAQ